ncbi:MAG: transposase [Bdellovibrionota bacterium]
MRARARQPYFSPEFRPRTEHGGSLHRGRRKTYRPLDPKKPLHLVLRSSKALGPLSLTNYKNAGKVESLARKYAQHFGIRILEYANAGNHLHLVIKGPKREALQNYFRKLPGAVAQLITGAKKGHKFGRFWDELIYSRVVEWGIALRHARDYVLLNSIEAAGVFIPGLRKRKSKPPPSGAGWV